MVSRNRKWKNILKLLMAVKIILTFYSASASRGVCTILSNIYDGTFCESHKWLSQIFDSPKYVSDIFMKF